MAEAPQSYEDLLETIDGHLSRLPDTRNQVTGGGIGIIATTAFYQDTIANLISLRDLSAQVAAETTDTALSDRMRAAVAVSQAKEFLSQRRVVGHVVLIRGAYNPYLRTAYIGAQAGFDQALQIFNVVATADDLALMDGALHGPEARQSDIYQGNLNSLDAGSLRTLPWDAETWDEALSAHANQLWAVETELDSLAVNQAVDLRDAVTRQVLVQSGALLAVLLVAILLAWLVARSMVRSLRALRQGALSVAQYGLPQAVARLRDPADCRIGYDDWEWGVDLFAQDPVVFKKLIYEMRFDEASARFAEFGPFYTGLQFAPDQLASFLGGRFPRLE